MECRMDHIVINVEDDDRMIDFYTHVLALPAERMAEYRAGKVPFPSVRLNADTIIDLFPKSMWGKNAPSGKGRENMNHFCMAMDRDVWEDLKNRLEKKGIPIEEGPVPRWGAHGAGTSIYFRDPEHNLIEARYYEKDLGEQQCCLSS